jgi:hypothetical protein
VLGELGVPPASEDGSGAGVGVEEAEVFSGKRETAAGL